MEDQITESTRGSGLVQAEVDADLLDIERSLSGAVEEVTVELMGRTFVFEPMDAMWEVWADQNTDETLALEGVRRYPEAASVAASCKGIIGKDGTLRTIVEMFKMPAKDTEAGKKIDPSVRAAYDSGNPLIREQWARMQFLNWLRTGSNGTGRSHQVGDLVLKLYTLGAQSVQRRHRESLSKLDPFFGHPGQRKSSSGTPEAPEDKPAGPSEPAS